MFLGFLKMIVFGVCAFVFIRKCLLFVLMQFSVSFYSLILFAVQLKYGT